jgi:Sulfotransferase domain
LSHSKIFGIGLSKTGTTSLYVALSELGYASGTFRHMHTLGLDAWFQGDFSHDYINEYDALTDLPLAGFYKELDKRYPGSLFILTKRELEPWLRSCKRQFKELPKKPFGKKTNFFVYGSDYYNEEKFRHTYEKHYNEVIQYFAGRENQLLCMDFFSGDGWDKLCSFLGKEKPDIPFPNVKPGYRLEGERQKEPLNKRKKIRNKIRRKIRKIKNLLKKKI